MSKTDLAPTNAGIASVGGGRQADLRPRAASRCSTSLPSSRRSTRGDAGDQRDAVGDACHLDVGDQPGQPVDGARVAQGSVVDDRQRRARSGNRAPRRP